MKLSRSLVRGAAASLAFGGLALGSTLALGTAASAAPAGPVQLTLSQDSGLTNGQKIKVTGAGADPTMGYYLSTCVVGTAGPTGPDCVGGPDSTSGAVWVSNSPGATMPINPDGTFSADLSVTQSGVSMSKVAIDCDVTPCAVTLFADHRNGFGTITETPIVFGGPVNAAATTAAATPTPAAVDALAADQQGDDSSNAIWWVVGGIVVVAAVGGGAVAYSKKK